MLAKIKGLNTKRKILLLAVSLFIVYEAIGIIRVVFAIPAQCNNDAKKAEAAYTRGDFKEAELYYRKLLFVESGEERYCGNREESLDFERYNEIRSLQDAIESQREGAYITAVKQYQLYLDTYSQGAFRDDANRGLSETYGLMFQDTGEAGKFLMHRIYSSTCEDSQDNIPFFDSIAVSDLAPKYWYPEADNSRSNNIAKTPAEFRIAVCSTFIQTTEIIETCTYNQTGSLGEPGPMSGIARMKAIYEIKLIDTLTGKTIAHYQPVDSKLPSACPQSISASILSDEIIGEPDFTITTSWIDEQIQSLK